MDHPIRETNLSELSHAIRVWAEYRNIISGADPISQCCKLISEVGELADGVAKQRPADIKDGIGDVYVMLTVLWAQHNAWLELDYPRAFRMLDSDPITTAKYTPKKLVLALSSNIGDMAKAIDEGDTPYQVKGVGLRLLSCLTQLAHLHNLTLVECVAAAYDEIKDRKGKMVDGVFVRDGS